ncbi:MAG: TonB-dependent receptor [Caulobacteraceae bacterium]|nr:TonB-dependent receptor [Caulobacteraceae bacterium]
MVGPWKATRQLALTGASLAAMLLAAAPAFAQTPPIDAEADETAEEEDIVVTGTSIRGVAPVGSNLISVTRDDIETHGGANTPDLSASIPQLNSFNTAPQTSAGTGPGLGSFAPALRGLPANATLPLMDGHRVIGAAVQVTNPDFPLIPNLALERIEVVADGASAIYGSDAVAGVVNFITRERFDGAEVSANYGVADGYYAGNIGGLVGLDWGNGSILAAYQYTESDNITGAERDYRVLDYRAAGGVDSRPIACPAPTVSAAASTFAYDPLTNSFGAAGTANHCDSAGAADILPSSRIHALFLSGRQDLTDNATVWGEILYSQRDEDIQVAAPAQSVVLYNPAVYGAFGNPNFRGPASWASETVNFRTDNLIGSDHFTNTNDKRVGNSSFGLDLELAGDLELNVYGTVNWSRNDTFVPGIDATALAYYANNNNFAVGGTGSTNPATALDPFDASTPAATVAAILNYASDVTEEQEVDLGAMRLNGPIADLPGGELRFAFGVETRSETFEQSGYVGTSASPVPEDFSRRVNSVYGELFIPIFGEGNEAPFFHRLALSLSQRYDDYSDFGSTSNPKVGLNWQPVEGLNLRGTYGTSFRAPGLRELGATTGAYYFSAATGPFIYPTIVNQSVFFFGGNPNLKPEEATTHSFGVDLNPSWLPNLRASVTYYNIDYSNVIGSPSIISAFTDPTLASLVTTGNPATNPTINTLLYGIGAVPIGWPSTSLGTTTTTVVDLRNNNLGTRNTDGLDFDINYRWDTDFGAMFVDLAGNYILNFDTRLTPGAPETDSLRLGLPRWTARATVGADVGSFSFAGFVNYRDGITSNYATTGGGIASYSSDAYMTVDLRAGWRLPDEGWTQGTVLALQINDVFDEEPPFFPASSGSPMFDGIGGSYNPIGRYVALNVRKTF